VPFGESGCLLSNTPAVLSVVAHFSRILLQNGLMWISAVWCIRFINVVFWQAGISVTLGMNIAFGLR
jgi:hypothetical protein